MKLNLGAFKHHRKHDIAQNYRSIRNYFIKQEAQMHRQNRSMQKIKAFRAQFRGDEKW